MEKLSLIVVAGILMLGSCKESIKTAVIDPAVEKEKIALVLEKYVIAMEKQDMNLVKQVWAPDPDIVVIGTSSDETLIGWEAIRSVIQRQFDTFSDTYISVRDQIIKVDDTGNTGWFSEILNYNYIYQGQAVQYEGLRFTGVLQKRNGDWFIVQSHVSIPASSN